MQTELVLVVMMSEKYNYENPARDSLPAQFEPLASNRNIEPTPSKFLLKLCWNSIGWDCCNAVKLITCLIYFLLISRLYDLHTMNQKRTGLNVFIPYSWLFYPNYVLCFYIHKQLRKKTTPVRSIAGAQVIEYKMREIRQVESRTNETTQT